MILLSNGHVLKYVVASGALAFDAKGWWWEQPLRWRRRIKPELFSVVIKTLTYEETKGNLKMWKPWDCVRLLKNGGVLNKIGLTNKGIEWWLKKIAPKINFHEQAVIVSISGSREHILIMIKQLNHLPIKAIEINGSCPNTVSGVTDSGYVIETFKQAKVVSKHPLIVKVGVTQDYMAIAEGVRGYAEAIALNSVPWHVVNPDKKSPLAKLKGAGGGGVSGKPAQEFNWPAAKELAEKNYLPVICPSIMEYEDLEKVDELGAKAYSFGAVHVRTPSKPTSIVERHQNGN
ncbi:MAG: hypothetical protein V4686_00500 [Patescibacteria group bacterium]